MIDELVSHYKILEKLGERGMGVVYKAQDTKLERPVALKFLPEHLITSTQDKARFVQEAKSASALNHPNVATVYEIDEANGRMFIAMEFVDGVTLREKIAGISLKQAIDVGMQVADGLAAAHEKGIIHRDIKPENIMIRRDGIAQIMDFGLAKLRGTKSKISRLTKEGSTIGTAGYMSPEQVQGQDVDHRSDIFSLGVVLYELFTGQLPFKGVHETALLYEIVNVDPVPMSALKPEVDPMLDGIVLECLAKDPAERYQSVAEVAKELRRFKRESTRQRATRTTVVRQFLKPEPGQTVATETQRRSLTRFMWPALSGLLAVVVVLLCWKLWKNEAAASSSVMRFPINLPLTAPLVGGASTVAISPDGRFIVFLAQSAGTPKLFLRPLDQFAAHVLLGTDGANDPFFSPDGQWVAFFAAGKLRKVSIFGGAAQDICDVPGFMRGGWWSSDSSIWYGHINNCIYRVSPNGGDPVEVTRLDSAHGEISHRFPQPLPDGKTVLFTVKYDNISSFDEAVIVAENTVTHARKTLIRGGSYARYIPTGHLMFARGSSLYAVPFDPVAVEVKGPPLPVIEGGMLNPLSGDANYQVSSTGTLIYVPVGSVTGLDARVALIDQEGKTSPLIDTVRAYADAYFSPDGQRISVTVRAANDDIWVYQFARGTLARLTFGGGNSDFPVWSPDGKRILYTSERHRSLRLFWKAWDGSGPEEPVGDAEHVDGVSPPAFSPDGKLIAYGKEGDIWVMDVDADRKSTRFLATASFESDPSFSPDGHWLSFTSNESGRNEIYVVPYPAHDAKYQISTNGGNIARWTRDGKKLMYVEGNKFMEVDVQRIPSFDFSPARKAFDLPPETGFLEMGPDGKKGIVLLNKVQDVSATQVDVVVGWFDELRQRFAKGAQ